MSGNVHQDDAAKLKVTATVAGAVTIAEPVSVDDNAGSLTVDGVFYQATQPVSAAALPLPTGASTAALQLPDGHNVTIDNAAAAAAVNIQDGGNTITVDGSVNVGAITTLPSLPAGDFNIGNVDIVTMPVGHNIIDSGTLTTVSAVTAITNALPAGTNAIGKLAANNGVDIGDVDVKSIAAGTNAIGKLAANSGIDIGDVTINNAAGAAAVNIQDGGNTITVDGTVTALKGNTAYTKVAKYATYAGSQVAALVWDPTAGTKFVITDIIFGGITAANVVLKDGGTAFMKMRNAANTSISVNLTTPYQSTTANNNLTVDTSIIGIVDAHEITVLGYEV